MIYALWLRDMKWFVRSRMRVISMLAVPFFWLVIVGMGLTAIVPGIPGAGSYLDFMAPGIVGMAVLFSAVYSGVSVIWDKRFGFMKEVLVAPASRAHVMLGRVLGGVTISTLEGLALLLVSGLVGAKLPAGAGFLHMVIFMVLISLGFVSMGIAMASRIVDPHAFSALWSFIVMPLFFLSGTIYPIGVVPEWLRALAYASPLTYGVDGLRASILGFAYFSVGVDLAILTAFSLGMLAIGAHLFRRMSA